MSRRTELLGCSVAGAFASALVLLATAPRGPTLTSDSVTYLSVAEGGWGFEHYSGTPVVLWPPGFPLALAGVDAILPGDGVTAGRVLNALLAGGVVLLTSVLLRRHVGPLYTVFGTLAVTLAWPMLALSTSLLSEPLFVAFVLVSVITVEMAIEGEGPSRLVMLGAASAALAAITRYVGLAVIAAEVLVLASARRTLPWRRVALVATVALAPLTLWVIRNLTMVGSLFGERGPPGGSVVDFFEGTLRELSRWVLPGTVPAPVRYAALVLLLLVASRGVARRSSPLAVLVGIYLLYVGAAFTRSTTDEPNTRLLAPLLPILLVLCLSGAQRILEVRRVPKALVRIGAILVLGLSAYRTADLVSDVRSSTFGYQNDRWAQSATVDEARGLRGPIFSNAPDVLWLHTGQEARITPCASYCPWDRRSTLTDLADARFVVWFEEDHLRPYLVPIGELRAALNLREIRRLEDGVIYEVPAR